MKRVIQLATALLLLSVVTSSFAGPLTNREEYKGDAKLTKAQQEKFQLLLDSGLKQYEDAQYAAAEKDFKAILEFAPKKNLAYFNLGLTKYRQGDYQAAIDYFDQVIKKRSYYVGAAFYYKSICQLNLDKQEEALKSAKRFTAARFFYGPSQSLISSIKKGSDEYYENAQAALADENYELCLLEMEESVFTDTTKGRQLVQKCKEQPSAEQVAESTIAPVVLPYTRSLYVSMVLNHTDNIYQVDTNELAKYFYTVTVGGEYVRKDVVDYGIGASYEYSNAIDLGDYKDEFYNVYLPVFYSSGPNRYSAQVYYNKSITNNTDAYSTWGGFGNYFYNQPTYAVGLVGGASNRTSLDQVFDYRAGFYSTARLVLNKYIDDLTLSGYAAFDQNLSGDQPLGADILPYSNKAMRYGASAAYDFTKASRLTLRANLSDRDYQNVYSPNGTDRKDTLTNYSLAYQHTFNSNVRAFVQQSYSDNDSNYGAAEFINKNYKENLTTVGVTLNAFK